MYIRNCFSSRRFGDFVFEFNSMLDPVEDAYDFGLEAQKFDDMMPMSMSFFGDGCLYVWYFTDSYVMEYTANLIYDFFGDEAEINIVNKFDDFHN